MINVVISKYYEDITNIIENSIEKELKNNNLVYKIHEVPGVWEIPYKINSLSLRSDNHTDFIAVGIVIKGATDHYEYLSTSVANGLINISIQRNVYISNCILNLKDIMQADTRAHTKGIEAVNALIDIRANKNSNH